MIWPYLAIIIAHILGIIGGIIVTMYLIRKGIREADIASDQKRMMEDTLGIRP